MEQIRPHDGKRTKIAPLNLNFYNFKAGEHVIYDGFGGWAHGTISQVNGNTVVIGKNYLDVRKVKARVPAGTDEAALVDQLRANEAELDRRLREARQAHDREREAILERHGIRHPGDE